MANGTLKMQILFCLLTSALCLISPCLAGTYSGGAGTAQDPYQIATVADWQELITTSADWDKNFILLNDIDFGGIDLTPVGNWDLPFSGVFEGDNHILSNATINLPDSDYVGLFGYLGSGGRIENIGVENIEITGFMIVGGLCGENDSWISDCYATGSVSGMGFVGGLCGLNDGSISRCYATGPVSILPWLEARYTGGLCGLNQGSISQCYATGAVDGGLCSGGLCGSNLGEYAIIEDCYGTGTVNGIDGVGGLCGDNRGTIMSCYAAGAVSSIWREATGGLCGWNYYGVISRCFWDMETSGLTTSDGGDGKTTAEMKTRATFTDAGWDFVGESANGFHDHWKIQANDYPRFTDPAWTLAGEGTTDDPYEVANATNLGKVWLRPSACYRLAANVDLTGVSWSSEVIPEFSGIFDGGGFAISGLMINRPRGESVGLFGTIDPGGQIWNLRIDNVTVTGRYRVGGLCGFNEGTINGCSVSGTMNADYEIGGLCAINKGTVSNCTAITIVTGLGNHVGGLCGINSGTILSSSFSGSVKVVEWFSSNIGGLCGANNGIIRSCSATGDFSGSMYSSDIGGLCGHSDGEIIGSWATVSIDQFPLSQNLGGLCGSNLNLILACYATGSVGSGYVCSSVGGLCGINSGRIGDCYATGSVWSDVYAGGLCGVNQGTITCCYAIGPVDGRDVLGGLCGFNGNNGVIQNCYTTGSANHYFVYERIGGFCGQNDGTIRNCYATVPVGGSLNIGGFCGSSGNQVTGCFWDVETSGMTDGVGNQDPDPNGITGKTTAEMKTLSTFTDAGWDFSFADGDPAVWRMSPNAYPRLVWQEGYSGGSGTAEDPYQIRTIADFYAAGLRPSDWGKHFILIADLDLQDIPVSPIGQGEIPFSGDFNGNGHSIMNLTQTPFDRMDVSGRIRNLHIRNAVIVQWESAVSGLVRYNFGTIANCTLDDSWVSGVAAGGMVIWNYGSLTDCSTTSEPPTGYDNAAVMGGEAGGLVAWNYGTLTNCSGNGDVAGPVRGGLVAINYGTLKHCSVTTDIFGYFGSYISGGLVAQNYGTLMNCFVTGTLGPFSGTVGGLVAKNYGSILRCRFDGDLSIWDFGAGLVDYNSGLIRDCYARGNIRVEAELAGLVRVNVGRVIHSYAACTIIVEGSAGGLILRNSDRCGDYEECVEYEGMTFCNWVWKCLDHGEVISSFWDAELGWGSDGGVGKTTSQMKTKWTFTDAGWDFVGESTNGTADTWRMCADGVDYPRLSWEFSHNGDFDCPDGVALDDLLYLANRWLATTPETIGSADSTSDGKVDLSDLAILSQNWLK